MKVEHTFPHGQKGTQIHTYVVITAVGRPTEVTKDGGNRQAGRGIHTHRVQTSLGKSAQYQKSNYSGRVAGGARAT